MNDLNKAELHSVEDVWDEAHEWNQIIDGAAGKDHLTGLPNRLAYDKQIMLEISRAQRTNQSLSLAVLDIDNFKEVNDKFGHQEGDKILSNLAGLMKQLLRKTDFAGRYGGEEFVFIYPDTSLHGEKEKKNGAKHAADRFRELVEKNLKIKDKSITVSIGVTEWRKEETPDQFFDRADKAMYEAKIAGRNKVRAAD